MESRAKVEPGLGKHSIYAHFPKDPNCDICLKTKITRTSCRRRTGAVVPRAENFGDLIKADHKVLSENCESLNNHRYAVVVQDMATQWIQAYPCKKKKGHRKHKEACKSSWSRTGSLKSLTLTGPLNLAKPVKIFPGITARLHHTDQKQMGLLREQCVELRRGHLRYCCNQVWTKIGGQIPWNVTPICETLKISCLMGKLPMKDVLGNHLKDQQCRLGQW